MVHFPQVQLKIRNYKKVFLVLLAVWFLINLIQALFMEVIGDEAYYALYGRYLDWGFYDHPPMVALMVKISSLIFAGNLGIRFTTLILQLGTIFLIWKILDCREPDYKKVITFFIIAGSVSMFSAYGVITTPDAPLLFFTALFLYGYRKFLDDHKWTTVFLLSISMAGLVYSKYQAVFVIGFVILSNLQLLKSIKFWVAGILALIILSPHIYWQIINDFPSFQYHLIDRSEGFRLIYFLEYLPNQLAVFNPLTLGAVVYILVKFKPSDKFRRGLYFQIIGFIIFFWLTSFRGHVEPHWTIACSIPMIILLSEKSSESPSLLRYTYKYILPSIFILIAIRIFLMIDSRYNRYLGFSGKKEKYEYIGSVAKELPVIFASSFQRPSYYQFFTGKGTAVISSIYTRRTQFDIWQFERKYHNKPVFVSVERKGISNSYGSGFLEFYGFEADSLQTVNRMKIYFSLSGDIYNSGDSVKIHFTLQNPYNFDVDFNHRQFPVKVCLVFMKGEKTTEQAVSLSEPINTVSAGATIERNLYTVIPDLPDGVYHFGVCLNNFFGPSLNSHFTKIKINTDDR
jgi:hypothetical protein